MSVGVLLTRFIYFFNEYGWHYHREKTLIQIIHIQESSNSLNALLIPREWCYIKMLKESIET